MIAWIRSYLGASKKLLAQVLVLGVTAVVFAIGSCSLRATLSLLQRITRSLCSC